jgi:hypothetical protein
MKSWIATRIKARKWGLIAAVIALPVYFVVNHYSGGGKARAAAVSTGLMILIVRAFWYLRQYVWYWFTIAVVMVIHFSLVIFVTWTNRDIPAPALAPIGIADLAVVYGCIKLVEKVMAGNNKESSGNE